jgi:hypothetical protein
VTTRLFALILIVLSLSSCASSPPASSSRASAPRTRCLADRNDPMRPLIFFLCVESP